MYPDSKALKSTRAVGPTAGGGPAEGGWPHRRWLQIINPNPCTIKISGSFPLSGRGWARSVPERGVPYPPGVRSLFCSLFREKRGFIYLVFCNL
jgi:hypothetical protein